MPDATLRQRLPQGSKLTWHGWAKCETREIFRLNKHIGRKVSTLPPLAITGLGTCRRERCSGRRINAYEYTWMAGSPVKRMVSSFGGKDFSTSFFSRRSMKGLGGRGSHTANQFRMGGNNALGFRPRQGFVKRDLVFTAQPVPKNDPTTIVYKFQLPI